MDGGGGGPANAFNCPPECCAPCLPYHVGVEFLGWWTRAQSSPPLVTSGSVANPLSVVLGQPNTDILFGTGDFNTPFQPGVRVNFDWDIGDGTNWSVDVSGFDLPEHTDTYGFAGTGAPNSLELARPFFNTTTNSQAASPVAIPGVASGTLLIDAPTELYGGDADFVYHYWSNDDNRLLFLAGGRFLSLDEALRFRQTSKNLPGVGVANSIFSLAEDYETDDRLYLGQVGAEYQTRFGPLTADLTAKVAAGPVEEHLTASATSRVITPTGAVTTTIGRGLYVEPGDAGSFRTWRVAVVPEADLHVGYDFNNYIRLTVGYTFLYASNVIRPGDQVNENVNVPAAAGAAIRRAPPPDFNQTNFWAQGFDAGLLFSF